MTSYLYDKRPLRVGIFRPEKDSEMFLDADGLRHFALGVLTDRLHRIVWNALTDPGPSVLATLVLVHDLTRPEWRADPERAVREIEAILEPRWAFAADQKARHGIPDDVLEPRGTDARYSEALGLFRCYVAALESMPKRVEAAPAAAG